MRMIPLVRCLFTDEKNGRLEIDPDEVASLARNMAASGQINPITVRVSGESFEVLAGRHRCAAGVSLGWVEILASVVEVDELRAATIRLSENVMRSNLSAVEEAIQLFQLVEVHPEGVEGVAGSLGRAENWVLDRLDLLRYPESLQSAIHFKKVSLAAAKQLAHIEPESLLEVRVQQAVLHGISASTAALWRQEAVNTVAGESALVENVSGAAEVEYATTGSVQCVRCENRVPVTDAVPCYVCSGCMTDLANVAPA